MGASANKFVPTIHRLPMQGVEYLTYIMAGKKKFEGRVYGSLCRSMMVGDLLQLFDRSVGWGVICRIVSLDCYHSFEAMLRDKTCLALLPQLENSINKPAEEALIREGEAIYKAFPGSHRAHLLGVVAIGIAFIKKVDK